METYRPQNTSTKSPRKLLLPLSCGVSSAVLLHILDQHLERQRSNSRGRTAYELHVLTIDMTQAGIPWPSARTVRGFEENYPPYTFSCVTLADIFGYDEDLEEAFPNIKLHPLPGDPDGDHQGKLAHLLKSISSPSAKADMLEIMLIRLIVAFARHVGCESIVWGHSNSRLASIILANVAKGRGASLPQHTSDGPSPWGINFTYPLRELFKSELLSYSKLLPSLSQVVLDDAAPDTTPVSIRHTSIDSLMNQYISSQEEKYPSLMANVVRTVSKLRQPASTGSKSICELCGIAVADIGDDPANSEFPVVSEDREMITKERRLCYGCSRFSLDIRKTCTPRTRAMRTCN